MPRFLGESDYQHGQVSRSGILLTNLGSPDAPTTAAVRRYLKEFLWDRRVVEIPRPLWWLILNGIVINTRPKRSAHAYQAIWTDAGSPLVVTSMAQRDGLAAALEQSLGVAVPVELAMRYGQPSIASGLDALRRAGVRRVLVLPMYPQYSGSTSASTFDAVAQVLAGWRWIPELRTINDYHDHPGYIDALATSIRAAWRDQPPAEHLLMSFHGLPKLFLDWGDPYHCQCHTTARLLADQLELPDDRWTLTFQSRLGKAEWLQPYTDKTLEQWGRAGHKRIDVVCPGFPADCLETLEEMAITNRALFLAAGGEEYNYIPALNQQPGHIAFLKDLVLNHLQGWPETSPDFDADRREAAARQGRERALALGAKQ